MVTILLPPTTSPILQDVETTRLVRDGEVNVGAIWFGCVPPPHVLHLLPIRFPQTKLVLRLRSINETYAKKTILGNSDHR